MPKSSELNELNNLTAQEVSLVDRGANLKKRFPVYKQMEDSMDEILKAVLETPLDEEEGLQEYFAKAKVSDKGQNAIKAALRMLSAYKDELPSDALDKLAAAAGYSSPKAMAKKEDEGDTYPAPKAKGKKEKETDEEDEAEMKKIRKAYDDEINTLKAKNETIEKSLRDERDARELASWISKAQTDLGFFPGSNAEDLGRTLKALHDLDPKMAAADFESKKKISKLMEDNELLREAGRNTTGSADSAWAKIEKLASEIVEKSADLAMNHSKAVNKVLETPLGQNLYKKYLDENPRQVQ